MIASRRAALRSLLGMRVQRVDGPSPGLLCLTLFLRGEKRLVLLAFRPDLRGVGLVSERPKGEAASPFVQRLRGLFEGGRLSNAEWLASSETEPSALALALTFTRAENTTVLAVDFDQQAPNLFLLRADETIAGAADERARRARFEGRAPAYALGRGRGVEPRDGDDLAAAGALLLRNAVERTRTAVQSSRAVALRAALRRAERKVQAIRGDLERAEAAPRLRREAHALLSHPEPIPRGTTTLRVLDFASDPPCELEVTLDPAFDVHRNAERRFERARKLERGVTIASARLQEAERDVGQIRAQLEVLAQEPSEPEAKLSPPRPAAKKPRSRVPYRTFVGHGGSKILVGKGAVENDTLTLTIARPHDYWLHARGVAGSHVVVPLERKAVIPQEVLVDAAHLAAHFSKYRGELLVEITHTERRFVRKQKGDAPGSVRVDRERVFVVRLEPERLARLLANEQN